MTLLLKSVTPTRIGRCDHRLGLPTHRCKEPFSVKLEETVADQSACELLALVRRHHKGDLSRAIESSCKNSDRAP